MMKSRFHFVLTCLTACLVLCAGSQAAVCELACGLGRNLSCHGSASAQAVSKGEGMEHRHCSGMMKSGAHVGDTVGLNAHMEGLDGSGCTHASPLAIVGSASSNDSLTLMQWVMVEPVVLQNAAAFHRSSVSSKSPPHNFPAYSLLVTLRV